MSSIRKNVTLGAAGTAVATAMLLITATPSSAASYHRTIADRSTIPANTGSLFIEVDGSVYPDQAGSYCRTVDAAVSNGPSVYTGQGFTITPYADSACEGATTGLGIGYRVDADILDDVCIIYGVNRASFSQTDC